VKHHEQPFKITSDRSKTLCAHEVALSETQTSQLEHYLERVRTAGVALVSKGDRERLWERHLLPSIEALPFLLTVHRVLDVGSGGGFPAIPLAVLCGSTEFVLCESNERKSEFLKRVSRETDLNNVQVICQRAESLGAEHAREFDCIMARAVTDWPELVGWTQKYLKPTGNILLWKQVQWRTEGEPADYGLCLNAEQPLSDGGRLIVLRKEVP
jgi:16S rRNA (guanine527-N7)-methyltransferase